MFLTDDVVDAVDVPVGAVDAVAVDTPIKATIRKAKTIIFIFFILFK